MNAQFVDWGALIGLLGLSATFLWRMVAKQTKDMNQRFDKHDRDMNRRFDKHDGDMAELRSDVGSLQTDMAVVKNDLGHVKNGLGHLRSRWDRLDTNIVQIMRDLARFGGRTAELLPEGEDRRRRPVAPKRRAGPGRPRPPDPRGQTTNRPVPFPPRCHLRPPPPQRPRSSVPPLPRERSTPSCGRSPPWTRWAWRSEPASWPPGR